MSESIEGPEPPPHGWRTLTPEEADFLTSLGGELQARRQQAGESAGQHGNAVNNQGEQSVRGEGAKNSLISDLLALAAMLGLCVLMVLLINAWYA